MTSRSKRGNRAVFLIRDFNLCIASGFLWGIGQHVLNIAIAWIVYDLTRSAFALGLIGLMAFVPAVPIGMLAGAVVDRYDRRTLVVLSSAVMSLAGIVVLLLLLSGYIDADQLWPLYAAVFIFGIARSFSAPAGHALVMSVIPREQFNSAAAWHSVSNHMATILGPLIAVCSSPLAPPSLLPSPSCPRRWPPCLPPGSHRGRTVTTNRPWVWRR